MATVDWRERRAARQRRAASRAGEQEPASTSL
eukprot:COSAG01_NODE_48620_length_379_cov_1.203571_1_plen_31_part_01